MRAIPQGSSISQAQAEHTYVELAEKLDVLEKQLASLKLDLPKDTRFASYRHTLERLSLFAAGKASDLNLQDRENVHGALLECEMFAPSIAEVTRAPEVVGWREVVLRTFADDKAENTPGRDALFELFIASQLRQAGFTVSFEEPDVMFELGDGTAIAIAAKRVKSTGQVRKRLRRAGEQIEKRAKHGLAAIQLAWFAKQELKAREMPSAVELLREETQEYAVRNVERFRQAVDARKIVGLLLFSSKLVTLSSNSSNSRLGIVFCYYLANLCHVGDSRRCFLAQVSDGLSRSSSLFISQ